MTTSTISAELFKLRTIRGPWAAGVAMAALTVAGLAFVASLVGDPGQPTLVPDTLAGFVRAPGRLAGGIALLLGVLLTTGEHRHRTILTTRLAQPAPARLVLAKAAAAAVAGTLVALVAEVITFGGYAVLFAVNDVAFQPLRHGVPATAGSVLAVAILHAVAGVGIGELLRNPAAAVGVVLGWVFIVEAIVPVVLRKPNFDRWLPAGAARSALSVGLPHEAATLVPAAGLALLAGYALVLLVAGLGRAKLSDP